MGQEGLQRAEVGAASGLSMDPPQFDWANSASCPSCVLSGSCHSSFRCFPPVAPAEDGEEGGHGSGCSYPCAPVPLLKCRSQGELSICSDPYLASQMAFNHLGSWKGNFHRCLPVPLAARARCFSSTGLALAPKAGQDGDGRWGAWFKRSAALPGCGGVGDLPGHAWVGGHHQGRWGGLPVLGGGKGPREMPAGLKSVKGVLRCQGRGANKASTVLEGVFLSSLVSLCKRGGVSRGRCLCRAQPPPHSRGSAVEQSSSGQHLAANHSSSTHLATAWRPSSCSRDL